MPLVYIFCFWFSLRLGAVLCAVFSALKAIVILTIMVQEDVGYFKHLVEEFLRSLDYNKPIGNFVIQEFEVILMMLEIFFGVYFLTCILLGVGAIWCIPMLCYPFIWFHIVLVLLDLCSFTVLFKYLMEWSSVPADELHASNIGLTEVIIYLTLFILYAFYDIYLGLCVYSLTEAIIILRKEVIKKSMQPVLPLVFKPEKFRARLSYTPSVNFDKKLFLNHIWMDYNGSCCRK